MVISLNQLTVCVFCKAIYLRVWEMRAGLLVVVEEVTKGHLEWSSKVISREKDDLTKKFDKFVSGIIGKDTYLEVWQIDIDILAVVVYVTRGYWRSLNKVIWREFTQSDQVCV